MHKAQFCIHGHFYQPPREDPVTGVIPNELGAAPYNNWNEKINDHCYQPNAEEENFEKISFNIGPTLVEWLWEHDKKTLEAIIAQDHRNFRRYGVGNAMAQGFNHTILPLSPYDDKLTQIRWGIDDFVYWYSHKPTGMWLPEAAVDLETLEILADNGIQFTILAPWQAEGEGVDTTKPYKVELPSGKNIVVFFYQQDLSTRVSFDPGSTSNADLFYKDILGQKASHINDPQEQLMIIASDGEAYGHHHAFRDKFLERLFRISEADENMRFTFPALWLLDNYPKETIQIREKTSWSCHHGVERWSVDCPCSSDGSWKEPLRSAFNVLGDKINEIYEENMRPYISDVWQARHDLLKLKNKYRNMDAVAISLLDLKPDEKDIFKVSKLLEAQYERQKMFTSCAWFFGDFDRIEPRNNIAYMAHAVWLTKQASGVDLSAEAAQLLAKVVSPRTSLRGDDVFVKHYQTMKSK